MKNVIFLISNVTILLIAGCQASSTPVIVAPLPNQMATPAQLTTSPPAIRITTPTPDWTEDGDNAPISIPANTPGMQITQQCLSDISDQLAEVPSSGVVVLDSVTSSNTGTLLLEMATGQSIQIAKQSENLGRFVVSVDHKKIVFSSALLVDGRINLRELVIADASGQRLETINWQDEWADILFWQDNEHLVLYLSEIDGRKVNALLEPAPILVLNIVTGEQQVLLPSFTGFVSYSGVLPYWYGRFGVAYDPTLTRAVYPRYLDSDEEMYTYAIWDLENDRLVATLEDIFTTYSDYITVSPMPFWTRDGSHFVVIGRVYEEETDEHVEMEIYLVSRDGEGEKLTDLNPSLAVEDFNMSWSPDEDYLAIFINQYWGSATKVRLAILDMESLVIMDKCFTVTYDEGTEPPPPIWSPDGNQILVWDQRDERVILVDIDRGLAAILAEGMEPVGWLINE